MNSARHNKQNNNLLARVVLSCGSCSALSGPRDGAGGPMPAGPGPAGAVGLVTAGLGDDSIVRPCPQPRDGYAGQPGS
jgi:hypothetical protein